jgi:hypothetical protein
LRFSPGFFERQVLPSAVVVEQADWSALIGPIEHHAAGDAQARAQRDRIGGPPSGGAHRAQHVVFCSFKPNIDRVAREPERGAGGRLHVRKARLVLEMAPEKWGEDIGQDDIRGYGADRGRRQTPVDLSRCHPGSFGARFA